MKDKKPVTPNAAGEVLSTREIVDRLHSNAVNLNEDPAYVRALEDVLFYDELHKRNRVPSMKVWVAMRFYEEESVFLGVGATKEAAQKITGMDGKAFWEDRNDGKESTCMNNEHDGYKVFEEPVWQ